MIGNAIVKPILADPDAAAGRPHVRALLLRDNVAMLALAEWVAPDFSIDGFWTYVGATIVVWIVNVTVGWLLDRVRGFD